MTKKTCTIVQVFLICSHQDIQHVNSSLSTILYFIFITIIVYIDLLFQVTDERIFYVYFFKKKQPSENSPLYQIFNEMGDYSVPFQDGTVYFRENHRLTATVYEETEDGYEVDLDVLIEWLIGEGKNVRLEEEETFKRCVESYVNSIGKRWSSLRRSGIR